LPLAQIFYKKTNIKQTKNKQAEKTTTKNDNKKKAGAIRCSGPRSKLSQSLSALSPILPSHAQSTTHAQFTKQVGMLTDLEDHNTGIFFYEISATARDTHSSK